MNLALDIRRKYGIIRLADVTAYGELLGAKYKRALLQLVPQKHQIPSMELAFAVFSRLYPKCPAFNSELRPGCIPPGTSDKDLACSGHNTNSGRRSRTRTHGPSAFSLWCLWFARIGEDGFQIPGAAVDAPA
jgi:hypothetical protein